MDYTEDCLVFFWPWLEKNTTSRHEHEHEHEPPSLSCKSTFGSPIKKTLR